MSNHKAALSLFELALGLTVALLSACGGGSSVDGDTAQAAAPLSAVAAGTGAAINEPGFSADRFGRLADVAELTVDSGETAQASAGSPIAKASGGELGVAAGAGRERPLGASVLAPAAYGGVLAADLIPGCSTEPMTDFIDTLSWDNRRVLPSQCEVIKLNPPLFNWRVPTDLNTARGWTFTLRRSTGEIVLTTKTDLASVRLMEPLPAGDYEWWVSYDSTRTQIATVRGAVRRFRVPADAQVFLPPSGAEIAAIVARKASPRLLPPGATFASIKAKAVAGEYETAYGALLNRAELSLAEPIPREPAPKPTSSAGAQDKWKDATRETARNEKKAIEALGFAWRLSGDLRYRKAGLDRLLNIASWDPNGSTSDASFDLVSAELYCALARGLDMYGSELTATQHNRIANSVRQRLAPVVAALNDLDKRPYDSHLVEIVRNVVDALLWTAGEPAFPEGEAWLASSWDVLIRSIATWGSHDGSWGNGVAYGWYTLADMVEMLLNVRNVTGFDLVEHPWVRHFGDFLMANTAVDATHQSAFGDDVETTSHYSIYAGDWFRFYAMLTRDPEHEWYWRSGSSQNRPTSYLSPYHFVAYWQQPTAVPRTAPVRNAVLFRDAGIVAMHDRADALSDRSTLYFRSSRFGSYNHSFADQNSFVLVSRGTDLLIAGGYYPWFLSPHHKVVGRATRFKNALTFDGGIGQAELSSTPSAPGAPALSMDTRGDLINFDTRGDWTVSTGDAALAYRGWHSGSRTWRPMLTNAIRSVAYNRAERVAVIYDRATSATARRWELNFNALSPFAVSGQTATVKRGVASGCIRVYGAEGAFRATAGFPVAPERAMLPQFQARFSASAASTSLATVTVIREDCRSVGVTVTRAGTSFSVQIAGGAPITFDGAATALP